MSRDTLLIIYPSYRHPIWRAYGCLLCGSFSSCVVLKAERENVLRNGPQPIYPHLTVYPMLPRIVKVVALSIISVKLVD